MIPGLGGSPGEGIGLPLPYSGLENFMEFHGRLQSMGHKESDKTKKLSLFSLTGLKKWNMSFILLFFITTLFLFFEKESLFYSGCQQQSWGRADACPKADSHPNPWQSASESSIDEGRGLPAEHSQCWHSFADWSSMVWSMSSWLFWVQLIFISRVSFYLATLVWIFTSSLISHVRIVCY